MSSLSPDNYANRTFLLLYPQFESFYMSNQTEVSQLSRFPLYYLHDMPFYREVRLKSNTTDDSVTIHLPRKVQVSFLTLLLIYPQD